MVELCNVDCRAVMTLDTDRPPVTSLPSGKCLFVGTRLDVQWLPVLMPRRNGCATKASASCPYGVNHLHSRALRHPATNGSLPPHMLCHAKHCSRAVRLSFSARLSLFTPLDLYTIAAMRTRSEDAMSYMSSAYGTVLIATATTTTPTAVTTPFVPIHTRTTVGNFENAGIHSPEYDFGRPVHRVSDNHAVMIPKSPRPHQERWFL